MDQSKEGVKCQPYKIIDFYVFKKSTKLTSCTVSVNESRCVILYDTKNL